MARPNRPDASLRRELLDGFVALYTLGLLAARRILSPSRYRRLERALAGVLGTLQWRLGRRKTRRAAERLSRFLESDAPLEPGDPRVLALFRERWRLLELPEAGAASRSPVVRGELARAVSLEGIERLEAALAAGRGAILWETTFGDRVAWKVALVERGVPLVQLHAPGHPGPLGVIGRRFVIPRYARAAGALFCEVVRIRPGDLSYLRRIARHLRANRVVVSNAFGGLGSRFLRVQAIGAERRIPTGLLTLARDTGAPLLPVLCTREDEGRYRLVVEPALPVAEPQRAVETYASLLRASVRRRPEQWHLWVRTSETFKGRVVATSPSPFSAGSRETRSDSAP